MSPCSTGKDGHPVLANRQFWRGGSVNALSCRCPGRLGISSQGSKFLFYTLQQIICSPPGKTSFNRRGSIFYAFIHKFFWFWHFFLAFWYFWHVDIRRPKSKPHERAKMPKPRHLWSLMMSTFESQDAKMPQNVKCHNAKNERPKMPKQLW